jgi:hypothetical protein
MTQASVLLTLAAAAAAGASLAAVPVGAQEMRRGVVAEEFLIRSRVADDGGRGRVRLGGLGARLLWHPGAPAADSASWLARLAERSGVGAFISYAPERLGLSTLHYGAHADLRLPLRAPLIGADRLTPIASLSAGAFRVARTASPVDAESVVPCVSLERLPCAPLRRLTISDGSHALPPAASTPSGSARTSLALTPALGLRVPLRAGGLALRADARDVVVFRGRAVHNPEIAAGISLRL